MNIIKGITQLTGQNLRKAYLPVDATWYKVTAGAGALIGGGIGLAKTDENADVQTKIKNAAIGAGIGTAGGLAATKAFYSGRMALIPKPKGKVILASDDKHVVRTPDGLIHIIYPDKKAQRQLEMDFTRRAGELGVAPRFIEGRDKRFVQEYGGETLTKLMQEKKITPQQAERIGHRIAQQEKVLLQNNIYHGDLNPGNITIPNLKNPTDIRFIDFERAFDPRLNPNIPKWQQGFHVGKTLGSTLDPDYVQAVERGYRSAQNSRFSYCASLADFKANDKQGLLGGLRSNVSKLIKQAGLKEWYLLGRKYGTNTRNMYLQNTGLGALGGAAVGAIVPTGEEDVGHGTRIRNAAIGAGIGSAGAIAGTRYKLRRQLAMDVPGTRLSAQPWKKVVLSPDGKAVTNVYAKHAKDVQQEIEATKIASSLGITPPVLETGKYHMKVAYGGTTLHDLAKEGKITPEIARQIGLRSAEYDRRLQQAGVVQSSIHSKNIVMTDPNDINTMRWIDLESHRRVKPGTYTPTPLKNPHANEMPEYLSKAFEKGYMSYKG